MRSNKKYPAMVRFLKAATVMSVGGGLLAGCSSGTVRFSDGFYTGAIPQSAQASAPSDYGQPNYDPSVDSMSTGSINAQPRVHTGSPSAPPPTPKPSVPVAGAPQPSYTPPASSYPANTQTVSTSTVQRAPVAAPSEASASASPLAAPASPTVVGTRAEDKKGWSTGGGTQVTVQQGDTIYSIADRYSVPAKAVIEANNISNPRSVAAGQQIIIPTYSRGGAPASSSSQGTQVASLSPDSGKSMTDAAPKKVEGGKYTVVSGDTLSGIASRTGASVASIKQVNGMSSDVVRLGQTLIIPGRSSSGGTQVASANVDPVVTSNPPKAKEEPAKVAEYTPPKAQDQETVEIKKIENEQTAKAPAETGVKTMRWPVQGRVINGFGSDAGGKANDGIDISVPNGTAVKAAENGVVIYAGDGLKELGNTILLRHDNGLVTVYGHVSKLNVKRGDTVTRGQEIASSGMSGAAKQPQLHFEVRENSTPVNPTSYLQ